MKKIIPVIIAVIILAVACVFTVVYSDWAFVLATRFTGGKYTVYESSMPTEEYTLSFSQALLKTALQPEQGISVRFFDEAAADKIVKSLAATLISEQKIADLTIRTYRSPYIRTTRGDINLQIALSPDGTVTVGTPLILGSY